jgi:hypothetical protein
MVVKVQLKRARRREEVRREPEVVTPEELARGLASLLTPAALIPFLLALWRLGADLGLAQPFQIAEGPLSSWIVWLLIGAAMQMAVLWLNSRGRGGSSAEG